jgi:hypothetical protein
MVSSPAAAWNAWVSATPPASPGRKPAVSIGISSIVLPISSEEHLKVAPAGVVSGFEGVFRFILDRIFPKITFQWGSQATKWNTLREPSATMLRFREYFHGFVRI